MARPSEHDGVLYRRSGTKFWWMWYHDRVGKRRQETTGTSDWHEAQKKLRERYRPWPEAKDQVDLRNAVVWIPDSKTSNGVAEVPLTELAVAAFRDQIGSRGMDHIYSLTIRIRRDIRRP